MSKRIHLVGVGGVGMSALAQTYLDAHYIVSGADRCLRVGGTGMTPVLKALQWQGVKLYPDDGTGAQMADEVIVSTAIEKDNPELVAAQARKIPVKHRAVSLQGLLEKRHLVGVAGTCGKSTVTAILGHVLAACGFDPVVVNGAQIATWDNGGARVGSVRCSENPETPWAVAEIDESDKSLVAFKPYAVIVTNASADHYSEDEMNAVFDAFVKDVSGPIIDGRHLPFGAAFDAAGLLPMPGKHNIRNAELAAAMALKLGADANRVREALRTFPGVERRMQYIGMCKTARVYDDYAHNPDKLAAMLTTLQESCGEDGVAVVWRPHGYGPLRKMLAALAEMFRATLRKQDHLFVLPVFDAGGTADRSLNSDALVAEIGAAAEYLTDLEAVEKALYAQATQFGALVTAGARDPGLPLLAQKLISHDQSTQGE